MAMSPDDKLDLFDAWCLRQEIRIRLQLTRQEKSRGKREAALHLEQPDEWQARGHASGGRKPTLSEMDGDYE